jgi:hypothetical protein
MKLINTEEPDIHWGFLDITDKVVLDLGCGQFYSSISTAEWFLNKGASKVVGVDLLDINLDNERFTMIVENIKSTEQIQNLLDVHHPTLIKCDIEGSEVYLDGINNLSEVGQIAIEYHDNHTKLVCENKIKEWGFENITMFRLFNEDIDRIGVIYAWK